MQMLRRLIVVACLFTLVTLASAFSADVQISPDDARRALALLQDPQKRAELIAALHAIVQAQPSPAPPAAAPLAPDSLGAELLGGTAGFVRHGSAQVIAAAGAVRGVPLLWSWLKATAADPQARDALFDILWRLAVALAAGLAAQWVVRRAVQRPLLALFGLAGDGELPAAEDGAASGGPEPPEQELPAVTLLGRLPLVLQRSFLELLPVCAFLAAGHLMVATALGGGDQSREVLLTVIDAYALCIAILSVARALFAPDQPHLRLLNISNRGAAYALRWTRRIVGVSIVGYVIAEAGVQLGLSEAAHEWLLRTVALFDHLFLAIIVLQQRRTVRQILHAPEGVSGPFVALRNGLARIWHWLALALLAALWLAWAVEVPHGYASLLGYFGSVVIIVILTRLAQIVVLGALDRALSLRPEVMSRYPGIEARLALYHPALAGIARGLIFAAAVLSLLQLWGLGALDWLVASQPGRHLISSMLMLAATVLVAVLIWEAVSAAVERHLGRLAREAQAARSARLRTLLPLLRTTLSITIALVAGLMVLSEIGVNIAPLLAGAGILGVAIGFGSQTLVRDLITGIFLLLENAMQVGDWVTLGGLSGTVENLSVRTIRLRAGDGSVHIVPFSAVTTVTNVNRGLGNATVNVCVAAREDTDQVCEVLKQIAAGMREDPDFEGRMLSDLQLWGVDKVDGASVTIAGQVVCTDSGRWSVQREFNRRMKKRLEELGIELYNPVQRMVEMRHITDQATS
jgi:small-conductance mechanosensitive channel